MRKYLGVFVVIVFAICLVYGLYDTDRKRAEVTQVLLSTPATNR